MNKYCLFHTISQFKLWDSLSQTCSVQLQAMIIYELQNRSWIHFQFGVWSSHVGKWITAKSFHHIYMETSVQVSWYQKDSINWLRNGIVSSLIIAWQNILIQQYKKKSDAYILFHTSTLTTSTKQWISALLMCYTHVAIYKYTNLWLKHKQHLVWNESVCVLNVWSGEHLASFKKLKCGLHISAAETLFIENTWHACSHMLTQL